MFRSKRCNAGWAWAVVFAMVGCGAPATPADGVADAHAADGGDAVSPDALVSPSGEPMPIGDLPGWHQIFADDLTTDVPVGSFPTQVSASWRAYPDGWKDTSHNGTYMPSKVIRVDGGTMKLHLHTEAGVHMVAAPEPALPASMRYGRYVVRFRADPVPGYKTAWLLWPDSDQWPADGEIDFPEGDLPGHISAFMHRQNGVAGSDQDAYPSTASYPAWHTAILEWTAASCRFTLDGVVLGTSTSRIPNTPMHWVLQTETQLSGGPPGDAANGNVEIDWVVVYAPA